MDLTGRMDALQTKLEKARNDKVMLQGGLNFYKKFASIARERHLCTVCSRAFATTEEETKFIEMQDQMIERLKDNTQLAESKKVIKTIEAELAKLKALTAAWNHFKKALSERQSIEAKRTKLKTEQRVSFLSRASHARTRHFLPRALTTCMLVNLYPLCAGAVESGRTARTSGTAT